MSSKLYTPENLLSHSPPFRISQNNDTVTAQHQPLQLFSHAKLSSSGGVAFIGGPVSALSFHPTAPGICVTAAHNKTNPTHILHKCYDGPAVIQLWRFCLSPTGPDTTCLGLIPHNGDCTFDLKWRPDKSIATLQNWSGTFAAALGDGSVIVCHLDANHIPNLANTSGSAPQLQPTTIVLRRNNGTRSPVRVVEWSPDGKRLVVGSANGNVEVFEADSDNACWPCWTIPAQESVISDIRWLSPSLYCTLGMSCVLRLCDMRDPIATLEQNCEGLQGSLSMAMLERTVAVVGADSGYLRVVKLSGVDQVSAQNPVRRVYLQTSSFRDMRSVSMSGMTVLYTGGSEGILHEVVFPRPLWPVTGTCKIEKTRISKKLRWGIDNDGMHLQINPTAAKKRGKKKRGAIGRQPDGTEGALFGERYKQPIVVTRIAINAINNVTAVGIDGGFITWLPVNTVSDSHATPIVEEDTHMYSITHISANGDNKEPEETNGDVMAIDPSSSMRDIPFKMKIKKEAKRPVYGPKRRRGRPRKVTSDNTPRTGSGEQHRNNPDTHVDAIDAPKNADEPTQASNEEAKAADKASRKTRKRRRVDQGASVGQDDGAAALPPSEVVQDLPAPGKRKLRKRRRRLALDFLQQAEIVQEAKDLHADHAQEETVPSHNTEVAGTAETTPHSNAPHASTLSGPSAKRKKAQTGTHQQGAHHGISVRLRLPIRKPTEREKPPVPAKKAAEETPPQPKRRSMRTSRSSITAFASTDPPAKTEEPETPEKSKKCEKPEKPEKPEKSTTSGNAAAPASANPPATADVPSASNVAESDATVPVLLCLRVRKRSVDEVAEPVSTPKEPMKRSKTDPQVKDQHSAPVTKVRTSEDSSSAEQEEAPARSRRVRKPSWRVRGE